MRMTMPSAASSEPTPARRTTSPLTEDLRAGSAALIAVGRLAIGGIAVLRPEFMVRTWLGREHGGGPAGRVLGRALGGRDIALAVGALASSGEPADFRRWVLLGAVADTADALATVACWRSLPRLSRLAVLAAAGGAAVVGVISAGQAVSDDRWTG
ncbi:MAG TPA: hypothetical protein VHX38_29150 [Pseudonocardiaceae bacterium]|jgi:hypothetical protein|nr:hypothetical protein [Pseudonocardiaceae bacterium]